MDTPLHHAIEDEDMEAAKALVLQEGTDIKRKLWKGKVWGREMCSLST